MSMVKALIFSFFCLVSTSALSAAVYDPSTGILTMPTVIIDNTNIYDVRLHLASDGRWTLLGYSSPPPSSVVSKCTDNLITLGKFRQITTGMTIDEVNSIVGCKGKLLVTSSNNSVSVSAYQWSESDSNIYPPSITILFTGTKVGGSMKYHGSDNYYEYQ